MINDSRFFQSKTPLELSKIGDPFLNLIYSLALSKTLNRPMGKKVSNAILSEALVRSDLRARAGTRMQKKELGNYVEGLIFKAWIEEKITINEAVEILSKNLRRGIHSCR
jgi:hypothetical protein